MTGQSVASPRVTVAEGPPSPSVAMTGQTVASPRAMVAEGPPSTSVAMTGQTVASPRVTVAEGPPSPSVAVTRQAVASPGVTVAEGPPSPSVAMTGQTVASPRVMVAEGPPSTSSSAHPASVAILLSTFNGERYLRDQLASFSAQTHTDWQLHWRDDGSSDATTRLMTTFARTSGRCIPLPPGPRLRATRSFLALLRTALQGQAEFFAYADQDDVWLPEKLAHGVAALGNLPHDHPGLYFCARTLVDANLAPVGQVLAPRRPPGFPAALTQNLAPGCCMMLNRAAATLVDAAPVPEGTWHDWWSYLVVAAAGGTIIAGDTPDILYRQHGDNLVGEPRNFWHRTRGAARRGRAPFMDVFWRQIAALRSGAIPLPAQTSETLTRIDDGRHRLWPTRLRALYLPGFARQTWAETLLFRLWFLLG